MALWAAGDPNLRALLVVSVEPIRGLARLRVTLAPDDITAFDHAVSNEHLSRAHGYLRDEVAQALQRKRVPNLEFVLLPPLPRT